jgi:uncharacterized protein (DUF433 family)
MNNLDQERLACAAEDDIPAMLSLREVTLLAAVSEAKIRKDIETGLLLPIKSERLLFRWADAYVFAAIYRSDLFSSALRKKAFDTFERLVDPTCRRSSYRRLGTRALTTAKCSRQTPGNLFSSCNRLKLDDYLFIDVEKVAKDVAPRIELYAEGLSRIEERDDVLGGEPVFRNTRLSVKHIGKMRDDGGAAKDILEDYPYLRERDVEFARIYYRAHPIVGRPRLREETESAREIILAEVIVRER